MNWVWNVGVLWVGLSVPKTVPKSLPCGPPTSLPSFREAHSVPEREDNQLVCRHGRAEAQSTF